MMPNYTHPPRRPEGWFLPISNRARRVHYVEAGELHSVCGLVASITPSRLSSDVLTPDEVCQTCATIRGEHMVEDEPAEGQVIDAANIPDGWIDDGMGNLVREDGAS